MIIIIIIIMNHNGGISATGLFSTYWSYTNKIIIIIIPALYSDTRHSLPHSDIKDRHFHS